MSDQADIVRCQFCGLAALSPAETNCRACGAALILRENIGELRIAGVTDVDPNLKVYAKRPLRIPRGSPSEALAGPTMGAVAGGDPTGVLALGALAVVAAKELTDAGIGRSKPADLDKWGVPSQPALDMVERLNHETPAQPPADPPSPTEPAAG